MKPLLVIIDPQNDFTHIKGHYAARHGIRQITDVKSQINLLAGSERYDKVIVRSDYKPGQFIPGLSLAVRGTFGHEIDADIIVPESTSIFMKSEHSCFSSDSFQEFLAKHEYKTLLICGFLAEYCIKQTALDALATGYHVILVKDAIGTGDDVQYRRQVVMAELTQKGCTVLNVNDCVKL